MPDSTHPSASPHAAPPARDHDELADLLRDAGFRTVSDIPEVLAQGLVRVQLGGFVVIQRYNDAHHRLLDWAAWLSPGTPQQLAVAALRVAGATVP